MLATGGMFRNIAMVLVEEERDGVGEGISNGDVAVSVRSELGSSVQFESLAGEPGSVHFESLEGYTKVFAIFAGMLQASGSKEGLAWEAIPSSESGLKKMEFTS